MMIKSSSLLLLFCLFSSLGWSQHQWVALLPQGAEANIIEQGIQTALAPDATPEISETNNVIEKRFLLPQDGVILKIVTAPEEQLEALWTQEIQDSQTSLIFCWRTQDCQQAEQSRELAFFALDATPHLLSQHPNLGLLTPSLLVQHAALLQNLVTRKVSHAIVIYGESLESKAQWHQLSQQWTQAQFLLKQSDLPHLKGGFPMTSDENSLFSPARLLQRLDAIDDGQSTLIFLGSSQELTLLLQTLNNQQQTRRYASWVLLHQHFDLPSNMVETLSAKATLLSFGSQSNDVATEESILKNHAQDAGNWAEAILTQLIKKQLTATRANVLAHAHTISFSGITGLKSFPQTAGSGIIQWFAADQDNWVATGQPLIVDNASLQEGFVETPSLPLSIQEVSP